MGCSNTFGRGAQPDQWHPRTWRVDLRFDLHRITEKFISCVERKIHTRKILIRIWNVSKSEILRKAWIYFSQWSMNVSEVFYWVVRNRNFVIFQVFKLDTEWKFSEENKHQLNRPQRKKIWFESFEIVSFYYLCLLRVCAHFWKFHHNFWKNNRI